MWVHRHSLDQLRRALDGCVRHSAICNPAGSITARIIELRDIAWQRSAGGQSRSWCSRASSRVAADGARKINDLASVCGRRAETVERRRRETHSETQPERNARRQAADGSPPLLWPTIAARDERADLRSGTGVVEGQQGDGQPVERSKPRVGHGG